MEVLTAYLREHARWSQRKEQDQDQAIEFDLWDYLIELRPAIDVQAVLTVLGRREKGMRNQEGEDHRLDLSRADLRGANLVGAHLEGAKHLTQEQINSAQGDALTKLPEGLERPARWTKH